MVKGSGLVLPSGQPIVPSTEAGQYIKTAHDHKPFFRQFKPSCVGICFVDSWCASFLAPWKLEVYDWTGFNLAKLCGHL